MDRPTVPYWHLWTDADGISRQKQCALTEFEMKSIKPADPQWQRTPMSGKMTTMVTVLPVGWVGNWHENPSRSGLCRCRDAGSSRPWTARVPKWVRASLLSAAIRIAARSMASADTGQAPSETFRGTDAHPVRRRACARIALSMAVSVMDGLTFAIRCLPTTSSPMRHSSNSPAAFAGSRDWSGSGMRTVCCFRICHATARCGGSRTSVFPSIAARQATPMARNAIVRAAGVVLASRTRPVSYRT